MMMAMWVMCNAVHISRYVDGITPGIVSPVTITDNMKEDQVQFVQSAGDAADEIGRQLSTDRRKRKRKTTKKEHHLNVDYIRKHKKLYVVTILTQAVHSNVELMDDFLLIRFRFYSRLDK